MESKNKKVLESFSSKLDLTKSYKLSELKKILEVSYAEIYKKKDDKDKEKKPPSAYNNFIRETMKKIKSDDPSADNKNLMIKAAALWKEHKESLANKNDE